MDEETEITVVPKRIGGSVALFLPADVVRRRKIREGVPLRVVISPTRRSKAVGALREKGPHAEFDRHAEGFWTDDE